jgi:hypothetical protein
MTENRPGRCGMGVGEYSLSEVVVRRLVARVVRSYR